MKKVLDDLYFGRIRPGEEEWINNAEYQKLLNRVFELEDQVEMHLEPEGQEFFEQYVEEQSELNSIWERKRFAAGFRIGVQMMIAVMAEE